MDESVCGDLKRVWFGCLIRDSLGNWPHGFAGHIQVDQVVQAKLMGIFIGL